MFTRSGVLVYITFAHGRTDGQTFFEEFFFLPDQEYIGCQKSLAVFPQACLCKRVVLVVFVASVHARAFWKALFTR